MKLNCTRKLFSRHNKQHAMVQAMKHKLTNICSAILPKVNWKITPKLPVYNRLFRKRHAHKQHCKALVKSLQTSATAESQENEMFDADVDAAESSHQHKQLQRGWNNKRLISLKSTPPK